MSAETTFWLGTHKTGWLERHDFAGVPLFISRRRLEERGRHTLPRARTAWALDSGGFSELSLNGRWPLTARQYVDRVRVWQQEVGYLAWAAIMDWMCEDKIRAKTGKTLREHQQLTCWSLYELTALAPDLPWVPVLQGQDPATYAEHAAMYEDFGFDLAGYPRVGVGSVCRRQNTQELVDVARELAPLDLELHFFGVKLTGLKLLREAGLSPVSCDSMAWSIDARYNDPLPGHTHKACNNCPDYALKWRREKVLPLLA